MRLPRYTIRSLLGVVLYVAIAIAALRASTDAWDSGVFGLTLLCLLTAVLLAVHRTDRRRAFWLGFALFGRTCLVASLIPTIESRLPTTMGLAFIDSKIPGRETTIWAVFGDTSTVGTSPVQDVTSSPQGNTLASYPLGVVRWMEPGTGKPLDGPYGTTENFICISHSLLALVLALVGGHLSRHLYGQGRGESVPTPSDSPTST